MKLHFSFAVLAAMGLALPFLPTLDAHATCPVVTIKAPRITKAGRPVTVTARLTNSGSTTITNGGFALTLPVGVESSKAATFPKQRGGSLRLVEAGQLLTWAGISLAPRKTLKIRIRPACHPAPRRPGWW